MTQRYIVLAIIFMVINYKFFYISFATETMTTFLYKIVIYFIIFLFMSCFISFSRFANRIWLLLLFIFSFIIVYFINTLGIEINKQIIKNTLATNVDESLELLGMQFTGYFSIIILLLFSIYKWGISPLQKVSLKRYVVTIFLLVSVFFMITKIDEPKYKGIIKNDTPRIVPLSLFPAIGDYLRTKSREDKIVKKNISKYFQYKRNRSMPIVSVLVIGESARSDRFFLNGYQRNTTPLLSIKQNLISFKNASSCDTSTLSSVPCLMLRVGHDKFKFPVKENSFVQIATDKGFDTYWLTLQNEDNTIHTFCEEAGECIDLHTKRYDMEVLKKFNQIVNTITKDTLIVIHTMGSHINYNNRVPAKYQKFQPLCNKAIEACEREVLNNSYDNTIYYTDIFLSEMINVLKNKNAFLLYTSDHGESLGETYLKFIQRYGHASPYDVAPKAQTEVPFILWFSDLYEKENFNVNDIDKTQYVSHDFIFHTMLGCAGFKGEYIDERLNLCQEKSKVQN